MRRIFVSIILIGVVATSHAQALTKEDKKRLKQELKNYMNDLESYHAVMTDIQGRLNSNDTLIKSLRQELKSSTDVLEDLSHRVEYCDSVIMSLQQENVMLKGEPMSGAGLKSKKATQKKSTPAITPVTTASEPQAGVVYKVQIGVYKRLNTNGVFQEPRCIAHEEAKGMNRYSIGYFSDENTAKQFMSNIRQMGIKDAFVTKYVDGQRDYKWSLSGTKPRAR